MKRVVAYKVVRYKPDSYELIKTPKLEFKSWNEACDYVDPLQAKGERGWRIEYVWG